MTLTPYKAQVVADIARDIAQVFFASVFLEPLVTGNSNVFTFSLGLVLALISWYFSIVLAKDK